MKHMRLQHFGFTLIELLLVIAIIGVLLGMALPAVQSIRESARRLSCLDRVRQLTLAALNYESARQRYPSGTLGFAGLLQYPTDITEETWFDPSAQYYWKNTQHTSSLAFLLPYLEQSALADALPTTMFSETAYHPWPGDLPTVAAVGRKKLPLFFCPSDSLESTPPPNIIVALNPAWYSEVGSPQYGDVLAPAIDELPGPERLAPTNYLGCLGAHSGADYPLVFLRGYEGIMSCRKRVRVADVRDGTSNTIIFGEGLGTIRDKERRAVSSWMFAGVARGRGAPAWGQTYSVEDDCYFLGDKVNSSVAGFGSMHPQTVNFAKADGSTLTVNRSISLDVFYGLCGRNDGFIITEF